MQNNILKARKDKGLSQADLAKRIGVTRQSISLYENNSREPKIDTWQKLSNVLGVSIPYLQGISSDPTAIDETIAHTMTNRELKKLLMTLNMEIKLQKMQKKYYLLSKSP
ncbi:MULTISPECIES: helix-turn-helix transcriptional regulator [Lacticaseibacillus]|uniref:helix-turn-helix transcriptional regulator n=1 Tax=Lacticaseibacillus TaxID=2759736 RepID=UPI0002978D17|nr:MULTISPECIES: helix-turn-helix transcriptional regulator [Lacticaseibacillus]EKQ11118.1 XRE family transcriptional regulator [Lacticaseibacillus paracasei]EKQ29871.1 XRE family transcriptional regulator [Lacticaseibacillus paracasei]KDS82489.1 XRE family transcriptional regulator [Lacticaseibacillus rhamnosus 51B]KMO92558.1 XRE family transcriptional regulator [Lacticaseibacillus rhamnosus]OAK78324.1 XRE family transcriptional regulator [Lacticaseibacillus rhamnosus]